MVRGLRDLGLIFSVVLAGCGSGGGNQALGPNTSTTFAPTTFKVGGQVEGLSSGTVTLQLNGANDLALTSNGGFTFPPLLNPGTSYAVSMLTPPGSPQQCTVNNATGTIPVGGVRNVTITCGCQTSFSPAATINGKITFDHVPHNSSTNGLNYAATQPWPARGVNVQAINSANGTLITCTNTDASGNYSLSVPQNTNMQIRVLAEMVQQGNTSWAYRVIDNTAGSAQWSIQSSSLNSGTSSQVLNLNAASGWGRTSYTAPRSAAPFAILDDVYTAISMISASAPNTAFPGLSLNWSPNNVPASGNLPGQIGTTYYFDSNIYILGAADTDTDEYDDHVIIHEFGHYVEDLFSRSDSIGGSHSGGLRLDMRVAFSEGWGNAFSGMATNDPVYIDSSGTGQGAGFSFSVENNSVTNPGWYSEGSVQSILYDLYDSTNDGVDTISLGFTPIFTVLTTQQKTTPAFTSLFTFITALKANYATDPTSLAAINALVNNQNVVSNPIDSYGITETNSGGLGTNALPIYTPISVGGNISSLCTTNPTPGAYNLLGNWRYLRLIVNSPGAHTITVSGDSLSDPDIYLHQNGRIVAQAENTGTSDSLPYTFSSGEYIIEVDDYNLISPQPTRSGTSCLSININ
ncbi:MAG: hypothetical protein HY080_14430 [Gammaproteobacteria bacterium]|nr:hypothetical protein [Gammaproteobacteria bacterium]